MAFNVQQLLLESNHQEQEEKNMDALETARQAMVVALEENNLEATQQCRLQVARILARIGKYRESLEIVNQVIESGTNEQNLISALIVQGVDYSILGKIDLSEAKLRQAAELSRSTQNNESLSKALHNLAISVFMVRGWFNMALSIMDEASYLHIVHGNTHWGGPILRAMIYQMTGDRQKLRSALDEMVPLVKPGSRIAGGYYYLWGCLALDEEEFEKAEEYLRLSLRIANQINIPELSLWVRIAYSRLNLLRGQGGTARTWAEDAVQVALSYNYPYWNGLVYLQRAQCAWEAGEIAQAEADLDTAEKAFKEVQANYEMARASLLRAIWFHQLNRPEKTSAWLEAAHYILSGGYIFILERERKTAFPLIAEQARSQDEMNRTTAEKLLEHLAQIEPVRLTIFGLGQFSVWQGHYRIPDQLWHRRKAGDLFRLLLLQSNHAAGRDEILENLWPDSSPDAAMSLLHQATSTLRRILEPDLPDKFPSRYLIVEGERVFLRLPAGSLVDFERFEQNISYILHSKDSTLLEKTLDLYTDELFPMDRYADWSSAEREHLNMLYQRGRLQIGQIYFDQEKYFQAVECARKILALDSWNEDAVYLEMKSLINLGNAPHALKVYLELEKTLQEELNIRPRTDLRTLAEQVRLR
jgi:DNA-binding SARP family transcriptional activator